MSQHNGHAVVISVDYPKAFDTVRHSSLFCTEWVSLTVFITDLSIILIIEAIIMTRRQGEVTSLVVINTSVIQVSVYLTTHPYRSFCSEELSLIYSRQQNIHCSMLL